MVLTALRPNDIPTELKTLGDHLKKRRLLLQQFQKEVSLHLGVNEWTYGNWENDRAEPTVRMFPKILSFLEYYPFAEPQTLGERILKYRRYNGISVKRLALEIGVDEQTLSRWERGIAPHLKEHLILIENMLV